jgi:hypothetical protein
MQVATKIVVSVRVIMLVSPNTGSLEVDLAEAVMASLKHACRRRFRQLRRWIREMTVPAVHASPKVPPLRRRAVRGLTIGAAAAVLLAYVGALGTDIAPFGHRLAYWASVILPGSVLGLIFTALVRGWGRLARHRWAEVVVVAAAVSLPHTFLVVVASALFFGLGAITPGLVVSFFGAVVVLALVLTAINYLAAATETAVPETAPTEPPHPEPASDPVGVTSPDPALPPLPDLIAKKLVTRLRHARLIAIEAQDHYLRIHTDAGSDLVLMRMVDACALLPESAGARVNRSWWAARGAVEALARRERKAELILRGGLVVPVNRAMQAALREQGWA